MDNPNWSLNELDFEPYRMEHFRTEELTQAADMNIPSSESKASSTSSEDSTDENFIPLSSSSLPRKRSKSKRNKATNVVKMRKDGLDREEEERSSRQDFKRSQTDCDSSKKKRHCSVRYFSSPREETEGQDSN